MHIGHIKDSLLEIKRYVDQAQQTCILSPNAPDELRNSLLELENESNQVREFIEMETAEDRYRAYVERLEEIGDRVMRSCNDARLVDPALQHAVTQAHDKISTLKHQLH